MRKSLRNIVLCLSLPLFLSLHGCPKQNSIANNPSEKTSSEETQTAAGVDNSDYQKALNFATHPSTIVTGNAIATGDAVAAENAAANQEIADPVALNSAPLVFEDFFPFNPNEKRHLQPFDIDLDSINISSFFNLEKLSISGTNPHTLKTDELAKIKSNSLFGNLTNMHCGYFFITGFPKRSPEMGLSQIIFGFDTKENNLDFLNQTLFQADNLMLFLKDNVSSIVTITNPIEQDEEQIYLNTLINYEQRINGEFYYLAKGNNRIGIDVLNGLYVQLGFSAEQSGEKFIEAMKFQGMLSSMTKEQMRKKLYDWSGLDSVRDRYNSGKITRKTADDTLLNFEKTAGQKIFYQMPNFRLKLLDMDDDIVQLVFGFFNNYKKSDEDKILYIEEILGHQSFNNPPKLHPGVMIDPKSGVKMLVDQKAYDDYENSLKQ